MANGYKSCLESMAADIVESVVRAGICMNDSSVFEELCDKYRLVLRSIVEARMDRRMIQRLDASDIVQEALLEAFRRLDDFNQRKPMPLAAWLRETAIQQLQIAVRKHRTAASRSVLRQVSYEESSVCRLAEQMTAIVQTAEDRHQIVEDAERTWRCLNELSDVDREILLLRYVNGLSNAASAELLNVTETVASKRHCRALVRLQNRLKSSSC